MIARIAALALLALPAAAQEIEVLPLAPPSEAPGDTDAAADPAPEETGRETAEEAAPGAPAIEFKRAPFRSAAPTGPEPIEPVAVTPRPGAVLRLLDMMTAETAELDIATGRTRDLGRLTVALNACMAPEDGTLAGTRAHLTIRDRLSESADPVFEGWMFAASPALSAMDHRRYDLWVISCTSAEGAVASGSE